jgi:hypothetical protein
MNVLPAAADIKLAGGQLFRDKRSLLYPMGCHNNVHNGVTGSTYAQSIRRFHRNGRVALRDLRVRLCNWYIATSTGLVTTTNLSRIKVNISIESPTGSTPRPFYYLGSRDIYIDVGQTVEAVEPTGLVVAAGQGAYIHIYATAVDSAGAQLTTGKIPFGRFTQNIGGEALATNASASDHTTTVGGETTAIGSPTNIFGPFAVCGRPLYPSLSDVSVFALGDSITFGFAEHNSMTGDSDHNAGWVERWLGQSAYRYGMVNSGVSSTKANQWVTLASGGNMAVVQAMADLFTHALISLGTNDFGNDSGSTVYANNCTIAAWLYNSMGIRSVLVTQTPVSSSTDSWATLTNQTFSGPNNSRRIDYNTLVRSNGHSTGVIGYVELADILESSRDSGKWIVDGTANKYSSDGIHGVGAAYALVASSLGDPAAIFT